MKSYRSRRIPKENLVYLLLTLICLMILIRDVMQISISKYLFLLVYCIFFTFFNSKQIMLAISFTIPFFNGLPGNWIILITLIFLICKKDFEFKLQKIILPSIILVSELIHSFSYFNNSFFDILRYISYIILISFVIFDDNLTIDYKTCLNLFSFGVIFMCIIIFLTTLKYYPIERILSGSFRYGSIINSTINQEMILNNDENTIGYYCVFAISILMLLNYYCKSYRIYNYFGIFILIFFGLLTMSRAFILTTGGVFLLYYVFGSKNIGISIMNVIKIILALFIMYLILNRFLPQVMGSIFNRFSEIDITGGRSRIFDSYNKFLYENMFYFIFGTGLFGINSISRIQSVPHNGFQQVFLSYGIIGFIIFIVTISLILKSAKLNLRVPIIAFIPFVCMLVYVQSIQLLAPFELLLPIVISFFSIRLYAKKGIILNDKFRLKA